jgi:prepilin-type N-terminal cleavage/methylation domain-containing protein
MSRNQLTHSQQISMSSAAGFTLLEMSIVLVIVGVLLGGLIVPFSTQLEASKRKGIDVQLSDITEAILGHAAATGRLPCPATTTSLGLSAPATATTACTTASGFVPARTLGLNGAVDSNLRLLDPWLNPIRYTISTADGGIYTSALRLGINSDLTVCLESACNNVLTNNSVAVVFTPGEGGTVTSSTDELENLDNDTQFVSRTFSEATGNEFNDHIVWLSPYTLTFHLVKSGQLN